jgi:hypothetical protein
MHLRIAGRPCQYLLRQALPPEHRRVFAIHMSSGDGPSWTTDELSQIGDAEEVCIAGRSEDGSLRRSVIIWLVRHDGRLFVRSVNGPDAGWYRATRSTRRGELSAGGGQYDVSLTEVDTDLDNAIDDAYREKYGQYPSAVRSITSQVARTTTTELRPEAVRP